MAYTRTNWVSGETPLSAENMNNIEQGIVDLDSSDHIKILPNVSLGTMAANNNGAIAGTVNIASSIPEGYRLFAVIPRATGSYAFTFYTCSVASDTEVYVNLYRVSGNVASSIPSIAAICKKI